MGLVQGNSVVLKEQKKGIKIILQKGLYIEFLKWLGYIIGLPRNINQIFTSEILTNIFFHRIQTNKSKGFIQGKRNCVGL